MPDPFILSAYSTKVLLWFPAIFLAIVAVYPKLKMRVFTPIALATYIVFAVTLFTVYKTYIPALQPLIAAVVVFGLAAIFGAKLTQNFYKTVAMFGVIPLDDIWLFLGIFLTCDIVGTLFFLLKARHKFKIRGLYPSQIRGSLNNDETRIAEYYRAATFPMTLAWLISALGTIAILIFS